ncbi:MAG: cell division protein SepF [Actinomycetota bacterium]
MSMWKKAMDYLGLGPDDAYDDYGDETDERPARGARSSRDDSPPSGRGAAEYVDEPPVRVSTRRTFPASGPDVTVRRPTPATDDSNVQPRPINPRPPVQAVGAADPHTVRPRRFESAQEVADKFKEGQPVILNLEAADREVSRRLIDFASGLCYGLSGTMEKVASGVYLLKPATRASSYDPNGYDD